jgi:hypothetical protein
MDSVSEYSLGNIVPNLVFLGVGVVALGFLGGKWPIVGKIGFWIYAVLLAIHVIRLVVMWVTGIALLMSRQPSRMAANLGQTVEGAVFAVYTNYLYNQFIASAPV